jgi:hypothetical protein
MNAGSLITLLESDPKTRDIFLGIAWSDSDFTISKFPTSLIFNTDKFRGSGIHWCAAYFIDKQNCEYFDPFGLPPHVPGSHNFFPILSKNSENIKSNTIPVQDLNATTCGAHCAYFIYLRSRNHSLNDIITNYYTKNLELNDKTVKFFVLRQQKLFRLQ